MSLKNPEESRINQFKSVKHNAYKFVILMGIVSLFADMTYEGAHSITGPFLSLLGASATTVGIVAGLGELIGYGVRLLSGYFADRTNRYWMVTITGYGINLLAVPLLALAGYWQIAAFLIIAERLGKAIRTPSRDAMLSHATKKIGRGWGFALHEAMDQVGALLGPLIISIVMYFNGGYREGFALLIIPAVIALIIIFVARIHYPNPLSLEISPAEDQKTPPSNKLPRVFWFYVFFTFLSVAGYMHFQLISYHLKVQGALTDAQIPLLFAVAMGVDALFALLSGYLFDKIGLNILIAIPVLTIPISFLVFEHSYYQVSAGVALWGAVMGMQETIMRSSIAGMASAKHRGFAYGIFNAAYGGSWFLGSVIMGMLYDTSTWLVIFFSVILEVLSIPVLFIVKRHMKSLI